jgi:putative tryptophan/tyrosine transport system substrate-binding protein
VFQETTFRAEPSSACGGQEGIHGIAKPAYRAMELLHELVSKTVVIGVLVNPNATANAEPQIRELQTAATALGLRLHVLSVCSEGDTNTAFATLAAQRADALFVTADAFLLGRLRDPIVVLAARYALPAMYAEREFVASGGLICYTSSRLDAQRQAGVYTGRLLKGEKPADLPVLQPTRFELVINLTTAKVLGLDVSPKLLALADEVIE